MGGFFSMLFGGGTTTPAATDTPTPTAAPYTLITTAAATAAPFTTAAATTPAPTTPAPTTPAPTTPAPTVPPPWAPTNPTWNMLNLSNWGRCLNADLKTYACSPQTDNLKWFIDPSSGLWVNKQTGQCVQAGSGNAGAGLSLATCQTTNANQQWARSGNYITLKSNPNMVAEVPAYDYNRTLGIWNANTGGNQMWYQN